MIFTWSISGSSTVTYESKQTQYCKLEEAFGYRLEFQVKADELRENHHLQPVRERGTGDGLVGVVRREEQQPVRLGG